MISVWVSGSAQKAIIESRGRLFLLRNSSPKKSKQISVAQAATLSRDWLDTYKIGVNSEQEAKEELRLAALSYEALLASSLALDKQVKNSRRIEAAVEAEGLLSEDTTLKYVLNAYCSHPMPTTADLEGAEQICEMKRLAQLETVIRTVRLFQENIRATREAWEEMDLEVFGGPRERRLFQAAAVRAGLFQSLMKRLTDIKRYEGFLDLNNKPNIALLPRSKKVLAAWLQKAKVYSTTPVDFIPAFSVPELRSQRPFLGQATTVHTGVKKATEPFGTAESR